MYFVKVSKVVNFYLLYSICDVFEEIVTKANKSPESTQDLIHLGQFMDHAYNTLLGDLKERIRMQLSTLGILLQTTLLTEDHLALNARTILWLQEIMPVFKKSSMVCVKITEFL